MGVEIAKITDTRLNSIAKQADVNKDNKLSGDEYQIFAQEASKQGYDYKTIGDTLDMNAFERWWFDVDKVSTDGKDDGKLSAGEKMEKAGAKMEKLGNKLKFGDEKAPKPESEGKPDENNEKPVEQEEKPNKENQTDDKKAAGGKNEK